MCIKEGVQVRHGSIKVAPAREEVCLIEKGHRVGRIDFAREGVARGGLVLKAMRLAHPAARHKVKNPLRVQVAGGPETLKRTFPLAP
jgi:hypothetical protein